MFAPDLVGWFPRIKYVLALGIPYDPMVCTTVLAVLFLMIHFQQSIKI